VSKLGIETTQLFDPLAGYWFLCAEDSPEVRTKLSASQLGPAEYVAGYVRDSLRLAILGNAGSFLVSPTVYLLIEHLKKSASNLIERVQNKLGESPPFHRRLTTILRQLLDEQVPIGDLAGILESLLSLREVNHNGTRRVYHFSELPDSPLLVADDKPFADLSVGDLAFAARTGVRSLSVRNQEKGRQILSALPLAPGLETALSSQLGAGVFSEDQGKQIFELLAAQPSRNLALVVSQGLRAGIRELLRFEFPTVPVLGTSEIPLSTLAEAYHTAGRTFGAGKRYEEALEMLLRAASLQPEESIYHYNLGRLYDTLDRRIDADAEYQLAAQVANDPRWRAAIADTFFDRKAYEDAIPLYREVSHESKKSYYFNRLGDSLYAVRAFCKAIEAYRQAILLAPQEAVCHANLAYALMSQGDYLNDAAQKRKHYSEAVDEFQRAITINRETAEYHYSLSRPLIKLHRLEPAAEELREAIRLDDKNVNARRDLAACLSRQGKFAEAVQALEASKEAYPSVLEIQMDLARAYAQAGEYSQAVSLAEQIGVVQNPPKQATELLAALRNAQETAGKLSTEPENAALFAALGHIHIQLGNLEAAVAQYRRAATLDPSNPEYYKWLGNTLFKEEEWEGAAAEWEKAIALAPDDALAINNLGTAYDNLEQNEKAMSCYQKASSLAPGKFVPQYNLGNSDYRLGNFEEARDAFQKAAEWNDKFSLARYHLGNCYYRLSQPDKAIGEWQEAIRLDAKLVNAHFNLGVALWGAVDATGESQPKAVESWQEALRLDRNLTAAEDNLEAVAQGRKPDLAIFDLLRSR
jgi:tetratricopeptide (TPR) repeat protein